MIKKYILAVALVIFSSSIYSQGQKFVFIEGLGAGVLANVNFDMRFKKESREGFGFRAGFGHTGIYLDENIATVPLGINYIYGKNRSSLLLGLNATIGLLPNHLEDSKIVYGALVPSVEIGYRFRPLKKGFAFQVTYNPLFRTVDGFRPLWFGVGLGYTWGK